MSHIKKIFSSILLCSLFIFSAVHFTKGAEGKEFLVASEGTIEQSLDSSTGTTSLGVFSISTTTQENIFIKDITIQINTTEDIQQVKIRDKTSRLLLGSSPARQQMVFLNIGKNLTKTTPAQFEIEADISSSFRGSHIEVWIPKDGIKATTGNNIELARPNDPLHVGSRIQMGQITLTPKDLPSSDIFIDQDNQLFASYTMESIGEGFTLQQLGWNIETPSRTAAEIEEVRLLINGSSLMSKTFRRDENASFFDTSLTSSDQTAFSFTLDTEKKVTIELRGKVRSGTPHGIALKPSLGFLKGTGKVSKKESSQSNLIVPAPSISALLGYVYIQPSLGNLGNYDRGTQKVGSFIMGAHSTTDADITGISLRFSDTKGLGTVHLQEQGRTISNTIGRVSTSNEFKISNFFIPRGQKKTIDIMVDILDEKAMPAFAITIPKQSLKSILSGSAERTVGPFSDLQLPAFGQSGTGKVDVLFQDPQTFYASQKNAKLMEFQWTADREDINVQELQLNIAASQGNHVPVSEVTFSLDNKDMCKKSFSDNASSYHFFDRENKEEDNISCSFTLTKGSSVRGTLYGNISLSVFPQEQLEVSLKNIKLRSVYTNTNQTIATTALKGVTHMISGVTLPITTSGTSLKNDLRLIPNQQLAAFQIGPIGNEDIRISDITVLLNTSKGVKNVVLRKDTTAFNDPIRSPEQTITFQDLGILIKKNEVTTLNLFGDITSDFIAPMLEVKLQAQGVKAQGVVSQGVMTGPRESLLIQTLGSQGDVVISMSENQPQSTLPRGAQDAVLARFNLHAKKEDQRISGMLLNVETTSWSGDEISELKVRIAQDIVWSKTITTGDRTNFHFFDNKIDYNDAISFSKLLKKDEQYTMEIVGTIKETAPFSSKIRAYIKDISYIPVFTNIQQLAVSTPLLAQEMTIGETSFFMAQNTKYTPPTPKQATTQDLASFTVTNGLKGTMILKSVRLKISNPKVLKEMSIKEGSTIVSNTQNNPLETTVFEFQKTNIPGFSSKTFYISGIPQEISSTFRISILKNGSTVDETSTNKSYSGPYEEILLVDHTSSSNSQTSSPNSNSTSYSTQSTLPPFTFERIPLPHRLLSKNSKNALIGTFKVSAQKSNYSVKGVEVNIPTPSRTVKEIEGIRIYAGNKLLVYKYFTPADQVANHFFDEQKDILDLIMFDSPLEITSSTSFLIFVDFRGKPNPMTLYSSIKNILIEDTSTKQRTYIQKEELLGSSFTIEK